MKLFGCILILPLFVALFGDGSVAIAQSKSASTDASTVDSAVKDLQSTSADVRQGAEIRLYALGPEELAAIETASKRPDLRPETAVVLKTIVGAVRPLIGRRTRATRVGASERQWAQRAALGSYDAVGKRNPKWDQAARDALLKAYGSVESLDLYEAIDRARQLGCEDPLLVAINARVAMQMRLEEPQLAARNAIRAADAVESSAYPASLKLPEFVWANRHTGIPASYLLVDGKLVRNQPDPAKVKMLQRALGLWAEVVKDPEIPESLLLTQANELLLLATWTEGETKGTFDGILRAMEKEPRHSATALIFKGSYFTQYAWDARGHRPVDTIPPEAFQLMRDRLAVASEALIKAYELNPNDAAAPTAMMDVELLQGNGKDTNELWFKRAMKANPDNYQACTNKLSYLEPHWYGSPDEMLTFARECRDSKNWYGRLPMILVDAHDTLAHYFPEPEQHFRTPEAWQDIQSVYQPMLNAWPEDSELRSKYAYYACMCGQWAEARKQFDRLGDKAVAKAFGDDSKMEDMRRMARNAGK